MYLHGINWSFKFNVFYELINITINLFPGRMGESTLGAKRERSLRERALPFMQGGEGSSMHNVALSFPEAHGVTVNILTTTGTNFWDSKS